MSDVRAVFVLFFNLSYNKKIFMKFSRFQNLLIVLAFSTFIVGGISFAFEDTGVSGFNQVASFVKEQIVFSPEIFQPKIIFPEKLANPPEVVRAVYVTGWSAGSKKYLNYLSNLLDTTEVNAVVIDIKDYSGFLSYKADVKEAKENDLYNHAIPDIDALVNFLHGKNVYVIARIAVFEDPAFAKIRPDLAVYDKLKTKNPKSPVLWNDNKGLLWMDPASKDVWDYNISIAKDASMHGFDEINFDYIRFPSDGDMKNMGFPVWDGKNVKNIVIKDFFKYLRENLPDTKISADLFGQTTADKDDMGIGQILEDAFDYFDYVCPMLYPSHFESGFMGFQNPAEHPYEVVKYSLDLATERKIQYNKLLWNNNLPIISKKFRPWLQDFNMGADYTQEMVSQEINAVNDSLAENNIGFMLWNPSNIYTTEAVLKPK